MSFIVFADLLFITNLASLLMSLSVGLLSSWFFLIVDRSHGGSAGG